MATREECNAMTFSYSNATLTENRLCSGICPPLKTQPINIGFCIDNCKEYIQKCVRFANDDTEMNYLYFIIFLSFMLILAIVSFLLLAVVTSRLARFLKDNHYQINIFGRVKGPHVQDQSEKDLFRRCDEGEDNFDSVSQSNASSASETPLKDLHNYSV